MVHLRLAQTGARIEEGRGPPQPHRTLGEGQFLQNFEVNICGQSSLLPFFFFALPVAGALQVKKARFRGKSLRNPDVASRD
jgi:hypothetical protein